MFRNPCRRALLVASTSADGVSNSAMMPWSAGVCCSCAITSPVVFLQFCLGHDRPHLEDGDRRQEPNEQEEEREEEADGSGEHREVPPRRVVHVPRRRQEVAMQAG